MTLPRCLNLHSDVEQLHKKNLVTKDLVLIAWIEEDFDDCFEHFDQILKNEIQIVVHPLPSGLFQIRVREVGRFFCKFL